MSIHKFERAGLGKAPFRCIGFERRTFQAAPGAPVQAGGSCDYCSTAITDHYIIRGADGSEFKVGSSCVAKAGDRGLVNEAKKRANKIKRAALAERNAARIAAAITVLRTLVARKKLRAVDHTHKWAADKGLTALDQVVFLLRKGGNSGKIRAVRLINKLCGVKI